jgi:hypothetical protein
VDETPSAPRLASAWQALVALVVCLALWTVLAAPILERNASAGPLGARRTAALAVLRPVVAVSDALAITVVSESVERALGRDPDAPPGGVLVLPDLDLPELDLPAEDPRTISPGPDDRPSGSVDPNPSTGGGGGSQGGPEDPVRMRVPTPGNKLRVAVIGDSLSQGLGPQIQHWMDTDVARVLSLGRQSTGLSRQDYFNWQAGMRQIVDEFRPDLVFVMLGSNDGQAQISRDGGAIPVGSVEWVEGYRERAADLLQEATRAGTRVVWVGIPVVRPHQRWDFYRRVNDIYRDTARADPFGTFVDTWSAFEARDGGYSAYVRNERGVLQEMRAPDGIHFTPTGYGYLGRLAIRAAADAFGLSQRAVTFRL